MRISMLALLLVFLSTEFAFADPFGLETLEFTYSGPRGNWRRAADPEPGSRVLIFFCEGLFQFQFGGCSSASASSLSLNRQLLPNPDYAQMPS